MGTNYYWHEQPRCPTCGTWPCEPLHIGKASAGWVFSFQAHRDRGLTSWAAWRDALRAGQILDEMDRVWPWDAFVGMVEGRQRARFADGTPFKVHALEYPRDSYVDPEGYCFSEYSFS